MAFKLSQGNTPFGVISVLAIHFSIKKLIYCHRMHDTPTDHGWKFERALELLMHNIGMFDRKGPLNLEGFQGSGAARPWCQIHTRSTAPKTTT